MNQYNPFSLNQQPVTLKFNLLYYGEKAHPLQLSLDFSSRSKQVRPEILWVKTNKTMEEYKCLVHNVKELNQFNIVDKRIWFIMVPIDIKQLYKAYQAI